MAITEKDEAKYEILNRIDILDLVSEYLTLKKVGNSYKGLCPFHPEKTPSFHVNKEKQLFYCFGCHVGGDAFTFLMKAEGLNYREALERLARRCGLELKKGNGKGYKDDLSEKQQIWEINKVAKTYFENNLWQRGSGLEYLRQRGLRDDIIKEFGLGFALGSWDSLLLYLRKTYPDELILKAGLICPRQNGSGYYDRFRNRVIFPINNLYNDICGFGARQVNPAEDGPKYLNSPETPVYSKGRILYGLYNAKTAITQKKYVLLVEGYLDFLTLFQAGFKNVVATLGTALTINQIQVLKRFTNNVVLVFDPDTAGQNAAHRGIDLFLEQDVKVKAVILPSGKDPDNFIREEGGEKFVKIIKDAKPFIDYLLDAHKLTEKISIEEKSQGIEKIIPFLTKIRNPIEQDGYIRYVAQKVKISEDALRHHIGQKYISRKGAGQSKQAYSSQELYKFNNRRSVERLLLQLALDRGEPSEVILQNVNEEDFKDTQIRALANIIFDRWRQGISIDAKHFLLEVENEKQKELISKVLVSSESFEDTDQAILDCIKKLKQERIAKQLKDIKNSLDSEVLSMDEKNRLLGEFRRLKRECLFNN